jgi:hypothetical protein
MTLQLMGIVKRVKTELSQENIEVIKKYDKTMDSLSMSKAVGFATSSYSLVFQRYLGKT